MNDKRAIDSLIELHKKFDPILENQQEVSTLRILVETEPEQVDCPRRIIQLIDEIEDRNWLGTVIYDPNDPAILVVMAGQNENLTRQGHFSLSDDMIEVYDAKGVSHERYYGMAVAVDVMGIPRWVNKEICWKSEGGVTRVTWEEDGYTHVLNIWKSYDHHLPQAEAISYIKGDEDVPVRYIPPTDLPGDLADDDPSKILVEISDASHDYSK